MDLGHNADGVIHVRLHLVTPAVARTRTATVDARIDGTRPRRHFSPVKPRNSRAKPLRTSTRTSVSETPGTVSILFIAPSDSKERRLGRTDAKLPIIPAKVAFEQDDDLAGIHALDFLDCEANLSGTGQLDGCRLSSMLLSWYPSVDTDSALATIRNCPPFVGRFRNRREW